MSISAGLVVSFLKACSPFRRSGTQSQVSAAVSLLAQPELRRNARNGAPA
jgi:hypothetical protein